MSTARAAPVGDTARQFVVKARLGMSEDFPVWITREEPKRSSDICSCPVSDSVLVVAEESVTDWVRHFGVAPKPPWVYYCICRCMGSFIE